MNVRCGTAEWLHFYGYKGDDAFAKAVWERIQRVMMLDDKTFTGNDWKALWYVAQSRELGDAVEHCKLSDRERMTIEASEETERLQRFIP